MNTKMRKAAVSLAVILCIGCTSCSAESDEMSEQEYEEKYQAAKELLDSREYTEAEEVFESLGDYKDSEAYASYSKGMGITIEERGVKETYDAFVEAGDIEDAEEYASMLGEYVQNCPGIYRGYASDPQYTSYIIISEELEVETQIGARGNTDLHYVYEIVGRVNSHYKIFADLGYSLQDQNTIVNKLDFSKAFDSIDVRDPEETGAAGDNFMKISDREYTEAVSHYNMSEAADDLVESVESYPLLSTEETLEILVGNTFHVGFGDSVEQYTFHSDNTYTVTAETGETSVYKWGVEDNVLYSVRNGERWYIYQLRKYYNGQYLLCQYNVNNDYYHVYVMSNETSGSENSGENALVKEEYFYECEDLLTPDSVDVRFRYEYTEQKDGIILHTYSIDADTAEKASDIIQTYYDYLCLDKDLRELEYTFRKDESTGTFYVNRYSYESMVAVMRGGYDEETGYFIICSMRAEE